MRRDPRPRQIPRTATPPPSATHWRFRHQAPFVWVAVISGIALANATLSLHAEDSSDAIRPARVPDATAVQELSTMYLKTSADLLRAMHASANILATALCSNTTVRTDIVRYCDQNLQDIEWIQLGVQRAHALSPGVGSDASDIHLSLCALLRQRMNMLKETALMKAPSLSGARDNELAIREKFEALSDRVAADATRWAHALSIPIPMQTDLACPEIQTLSTSILGALLGEPAQALLSRLHEEGKQVSSSNTTDSCAGEPVEVMEITSRDPNAGTSNVVECILYRALEGRIYSARMVLPDTARNRYLALGTTLRSKYRETKDGQSGATWRFERTVDSHVVSVLLSMHRVARTQDTGLSEPQPAVVELQYTHGSLQQALFRRHIEKIGERLVIKAEE